MFSQIMIPKELAFPNDFVSNEKAEELFSYKTLKLCWDYRVGRITNSTVGNTATMFWLFHASIVFFIASAQDFHNEKYCTHACATILCFTIITGIAIDSQRSMTLEYYAVFFYS